MAIYPSTSIVPIACWKMNLIRPPANSHGTCTVRK